jgi:hypothetical protein
LVRLARSISGKVKVAASLYYRALRDMGRTLYDKIADEHIVRQEGTTCVAATGPVIRSDRRSVLLYIGE